MKTEATHCDKCGAELKQLLFYFSKYCPNDCDRVGLIEAESVDYTLISEQTLKNLNTVAWSKGRGCWENFFIVINNYGKLYAYSKVHNSLNTWLPTRNKWQPGGTPQALEFCKGLK